MLCIFAGINIKVNLHVMECPFCSSQIQQSCFYESEEFMAIYNIAPVLPGHSMVIPRRHITRFLDLDEEALYRMVSFSRKVARLLIHAFDTESFDWAVQEGIEAGQSIEHLHLHILPRHPGDLPHPGDWYPRVEKNDKEMLDSEFRTQLKDEQLIQIVMHLKSIGQNFDGL
jgi:bis(5'-adenosyl)-triphosphatase